MQNPSSLLCVSAPLRATSSLTTNPSPLTPGDRVRIRLGHRIEGHATLAAPRPVPAKGHRECWQVLFDGDRQNIVYTRWIGPADKLPADAPQRPHFLGPVKFAY